MKDFISLPASSAQIKAARWNNQPKKHNLFNDHSKGFSLICIYLAERKRGRRPVRDAVPADHRRQTPSRRHGRRPPSPTSVFLAPKPYLVF